jgi:hypothetical protein
VEAVNGVSCNSVCGPVVAVVVGSIVVICGLAESVVAGALFSVIINVVISRTFCKTAETVTIYSSGFHDFDILLSGHGILLKPGAAEKVRNFAKSLP